VTKPAVDQHAQDVAAIPDVEEPIRKRLPRRRADPRPFVKPPKSKPGKA
jgi:hypothetical protein